MYYSTSNYVCKVFFANFLYFFAKNPEPLDLTKKETFYFFKKVSFLLFNFNYLGNFTVKMVPFGKLCDALILPLWALTMVLAIESPSPLPPVSRLRARSSL